MCTWRAADQAAKLDAAGFGDDYNKLDEAITFGYDNINDVRRELKYGGMSKEAIKEEVGYDLEIDLV